MSSNKGQIQQAFVFILFILVAGFIVILGYKGITGFTEDSCEAERLNFQSKMEGFFDRYDSYGSVQRERLNLPCTYQMVCFVNYSVNEGATVVGGDNYVEPDKQPVIQSARNTENNIFLVGEFAEPAGYSDKVRVEGPGNVLCTSASELVFRGQGRSTLVVEG